eukprot:scaffold217276_cov30-Tisochrysis_lutea.AAC.1
MHEVNNAMQANNRARVRHEVNDARGLVMQVQASYMGEDSRGSRACVMYVCVSGSMALIARCMHHWLFVHLTWHHIVWVHAPLTANMQFVVNLPGHHNAWMFTSMLVHELAAHGSSQRYTLRMKQHTPPTPGQPNKEPLLIPVAVGLVGPDGECGDAQHRNAARRVDVCLVVSLNLRRVRVAFGTLRVLDALAGNSMSNAVARISAVCVASAMLLPGYQLVCSGLMRLLLKWPSTVLFGGSSMALDGQVIQACRLPVAPGPAFPLWACKTCALLPRPTPH